MTQTWIEELEKILDKDNISVDSEIRAKHGHDASSHPPVLPTVVVWPTSTDEVSKIVAIAEKNFLSVTAFGKGTSLEGNSIPVRGGICVDLSRMNKVINLYEKDFQVEVEPGIVGAELNQFLATKGFFFPPFPASAKIASLGGMVANNAGGMYAIKYGVVGDWVLKLEVVLANGKIITVGSRSLKTVAGYDLKDLFIASEGTLGIITRITLKIIPVVLAKQLIVVSFPSISGALAATLSMINKQVDPAALEFLDKESVRFINVFKKISWKTDPTIIIELHGSTSEFSIRTQAIKEICTEQGMTSFTVIKESEQQRLIWEARSAVHPAIKASFPNGGIIPGDIGIPISAIPEFMKTVENLSAEKDISAATFGHIGDGNLHVWLIYEKNEKEIKVRAQKISEKLVNRALELGGTCTAEHGVGIGKRKYLEKEHGDSLFLMKAIKKIFDPNNILNPGKMF